MERLPLDVSGKDVLLGRRLKYGEGRLKRTDIVKKEIKHLDLSEDLIHS